MVVDRPRLWQRTRTLAVRTEQTLAPLCERTLSPTAMSVLLVSSTTGMPNSRPLVRRMSCTTPS
eukprot:364367-Chlamydomonas_euryale.AAC.16